MAEGTDTYMGQAVPLYPANGFEIKQQTSSSAVDVLTVTAASGAATGDFIVCQTNSGTEAFVVEDDGTITLGVNSDVALTKTDHAAFGRLRLPILNTAPASAGLNKGDLWLSKSTTDVYRITLCISSATGAVRYGPNIVRQTIGTASN